MFYKGRWWEYIYDNGEFKTVEGEPEDFNVDAYEGFIYDETYHLEGFLEKIFLKTSKVLIIDYGYDDEEFLIYAPEGSMSGYKSHKVFYGFDALRKGVDITHFVNFSRVRRIASRLGFKVKIYMPQNEFLLRYGILEVFEKLDRDKKEKLSNGMKTLLFQFKNHRVMCLCKSC